MTRTRSLVALAVVTALVAAGAIVTHQDSGAVPRSGELVYPDLLDRVNEAVRVEADAGETAFALERRDGRWVAPDKHAYPADEGKIRELLVGAAALERIEPKTDNPELYSKIGVQDADAEGAESIRFRVGAGGDGDLFSLLVGNASPSRSDPDAFEYYVRVGDDARAWLVEGELPSARTLVEWLDTTLASIERPRIRRVEVAHPDGDRVVVARDDPFGDDFDVRGAPGAPEPEAETQWRVNDIGRFAENLALEDVRPASEGPLPAGERRTVTIETFDGLRIRVETASEDDATWATLDAAFDAALVESFEAGAGDAAAAREATLAKLLDREAVEREVERLDARWAGWVYRLPDFKAEYIAKRTEDLVAAPEAEAPGEAPASGPGDADAPDTGEPDAAEPDAGEPDAAAPDADAPAADAADRG